MEEKPNYYAVIPATIRYDKDLKANAKLMYGEITALSSKYGECTASNNYFARLYEVNPSAISKWITELKEKNYIEVEYKTKGKEIETRIIKIIGTDIWKEVFPKEQEGYFQKSKENNTSINNTSKEKNIKKESFKKPTLEEVVAYCKERNNTVDAKRFFDYYDTDNWKDVKNWKKKLITWEMHQPKKKDREKEIEDMCKRLAYLDEEQ